MKKPEKHEEEKQKQPAGDAASNQPEENQDFPPQNGSSSAPESESAPESAQEPLIGLTMAEYTEMQEKIAQAEQKSKEHFEGWQRERADFLNYRKRGRTGKCPASPEPDRSDHQKIPGDSGRP